MINNSILRRLIMRGIVGSCFCIAILVAMPKLAFPALVTWNVDADGFWHVPSNWSSNPSLPGSSDDVTIDRPTVTLTVTHSQGTDTINSLLCNENLTLSGGSLTVTNTTQINNNFTISGGTVNFNSGSASLVPGTATLSSGYIGGSGEVRFNNLSWTAGTMTGSGTTEVSSGNNLTIGGSAYHSLARTINNYGNTMVTGSSGLNPYSGGSTPTFNNKAGGIFELQSIGGLDSYSSLTGVFNNEGTFRKTTGTGTANVSYYWTLNNPGTVQVQSGTLSISGTFNNTGTAEAQAGNTLTLSGGGTSTGAFNVASGAVINFSNGTHNLGGSTFTNAGTLNFSGGTAVFDSATTLPGTVNFNGGTVNFNSGSASLVPGTATLSSGYIGGSGEVRFNNLSWTGGGISSSGGVTIPSGGSLAITANNQGFYLSGGTPILNNSGNVTLNGSGTIYSFNATTATINNQSGGVFDVQSDAGFGIYGTGVWILNNAGMFKKSAGSGTTYIPWTVNNTGTVQIQSGTLIISRVFNNTGTADIQVGTLSLGGGGTSTGTFYVSSSAVLTFAGGTHNLGGSNFNNVGAINFSGGTENFDTPITLPGVVNFSGGTVNFNSGSASLVPGTATLSSGYIGGSGEVRFNNLSWTGGGISSSGGVTIPSGGSLAITANNQGFYLSGGTPILNNSGNVTLNGSGTIYSFNATTATINNQSGGVFDVQSDAGFGIYGTGVWILNNAGMFKKSAGSGTSSIGWTFNNTGTLQVQSGTLNLQADLLNDGILTVGTGSSLLVNGDLTGSGNIVIDGLMTVDSISQNGICIGSGGKLVIRSSDSIPLIDNDTVQAVPEPGTLSLLLIVLALICGIRKLAR